MPESSSPAVAGAGGQDEALTALLRDVRAELGDFGYQWLAACAVYPRLHWHLTVYLGAELAKARRVSPPDENAHLALARLSWFRKGSMRDDLRLRLLADLDPDNRETVREAIKRLFHRAMVEPGDATTTFEIDIARTPPPGWREALRRLLARAEPDAPVHDAIFVRYMMGRTPRPLDLRLDRALVRLFGARFAGWFDLTTLAALFAAGAIAVVCWCGGQWLIDRHLSERTVAIPASALQPRDVFRDRLDQDASGMFLCPQMVAIPAGTFLMGSPESEGGQISEGPQHEVTIKPFAIGTYEVTVAEYRRFVKATDRRQEGGMYIRTGSEWKREILGFVQTDQHPVVGVRWEDAQAYVEWLSKTTGKPYRLPTEAEWEYAARASTTTPFALPAPEGSRDITGKNLANCRDCGSEWDGKSTAPVGSFPANAWDLHDLHGNVWEWVEDVWHDSYEGAPKDGSAWTDNSPFRVFRGGSWFNGPGYLRSALRSGVVPDLRDDDLGFRVARTLN